MIAVKRQNESGRQLFSSQYNPGFLEITAEVLVRQIYYMPFKVNAVVSAAVCLI